MNNPSENQETPAFTARAFRDGLKTLPQKIKLRARLPIWAVRVLFGGVLLIFSEIIVWQNPTARDWYEWLALYILYTALGAFFLDVISRFRVVTPAAVGLACGIYGILSGTLINHSLFDNLPFGLILRTLGLQVGAGFLALMLFIIVLRGKPPEIWHIAAAIITGAAWGVWAKWYPQQTLVGWESLTTAQAQTLLVVPLFLLAGGFGVLPRFQTLTERVFLLTWWEMILCGAPLFIALMLGVALGAIPFFLLIIPVILISYCVWALNAQKSGDTPSILAEITFAAPNFATYLILASGIVVTGSIAYAAIPDKDSPIGAALYILVFGFGIAWLPFASLLLFWSVARAGGFGRRRNL
ncbi:MAG: hypothetical protein OHK0023_06570 [Anaerolineae bacterium]